MIYLVSCKNIGTTTNNIQTQKNEVVDTTQHKDRYNKIGQWELHGNEPFWHITINNQDVIFTKLNEKIDTTLFKVEDFLFIDGGISFQLIDINNNIAQLGIYKNVDSISDGMSDKLYIYRTRLNYAGIELKGVAEKK
jgi:uncharacterized membrane protein